MIKFKSNFNLRQFSLALLMILIAVPLRAQEETVTLNLKNVPIRTVLNRIEKKTPYTFVYFESDFNLDKKVTVEVKKATIKSVVKSILPQAALKIDNKKIILSRRKEGEPAKSSSKTATQSTVTDKNLTQWRLEGIVRDEKGEPLIGATVMQKGVTGSGASTDMDGKFSLQVKGDDPTIIARYVGYEPMEEKAKKGQPLNISMSNSAVALDEVVVTSLGIKREQKSLGYSVSKVDGEELTNTVSGNWLNNLNGKVAGLTLSNAASGPLGSMRVVLRGEQSLNYGSNEALFVVDGVPITSGDATTGSGFTTSTDSPIDFGNGASEINPDDVETVTVLKGPAATALYGSRAANGAIVITTKSGRKQKGIGITLNSSVTWEKAGFFPDFQGVYGPGNDCGFGEFAMWNIKNADVPEGFPTSRNSSRGSWGEAYSADKLRNQYNSYNRETGEFTLTPFLYADDWYTGFLETGTTFRNSVTISSNNGKGNSSRLSVTDVRNSWILPNTGYRNQTVSLAFNQKINKWFTITSRVNYLHKSSDNMPVTGYNSQSPFYMLTWGLTNIHPWQYKEEYLSGRCDALNYGTRLVDGVGMITSAHESKPYNPYRQMYEATNAINKNRVYGNVMVSVNFPVKGLTLDVRGGLDISMDWRQQKKPFRTPNYERGFYREQNNRDSETNVDFLLKYQNLKLVDGRFGLIAAFGGNSMERRAFRNVITLKNLGEEGVYNTTNVPEGEVPVTAFSRSKKVVNSFYGFVNMSWDNAYFLDITGRNDWSSALGRGNWSFFYPSVSASVLLDRALKFQEKGASWIDMLKVRANWANVGNDTDPYTLIDQYVASSAYPSSYLLPTSISNYYIRPENIQSWEAGIETMFLLNRIGLDMALYSSNTTNQIVSAVSDMFIGASGRKMNAGKVSNKGIELTLHAVPVRVADFTWNVDINWSRNWNKLVSLEDSWDPTAAFIQNAGTGGSYCSIRSYLGEEMYWIYGKGYKRAPEGSTYVDANGNVVDCSGMKIIDPQSGVPFLDNTADTRIAKVNPTWKGGMTHNFRYRDFTLSMSFAAQMGGHAYSNTAAVLTHLGKTANTLEGRYDGLLVEGVVATENADGTITYTPNTTPVANIMNYYQLGTGRDNAEEHTYKTDFFKLAELRLEYSLPTRLCRKTKVLQGASLAFYATNLFCLTSFPQFDPEAGTLYGNNIVKGAEMGALPMTRTFGVNLKLSF